MTELGCKNGMNLESPRGQQLALEVGQEAGAQRLRAVSAGVVRRYEESTQRGQQSGQACEWGGVTF